MQKVQVVMFTSSSQILLVLGKSARNVTGPAQLESTFFAPEPNETHAQLIFQQ